MLHFYVSDSNRSHDGGIGRLHNCKYPRFVCTSNKRAVALKVQHSNGTRDNLLHENKHSNHGCAVQFFYKYMTCLPCLIRFTRCFHAKWYADYYVTE